MFYRSYFLHMKNVLIVFLIIHYDNKLWIWNVNDFHFKNTPNITLLFIKMRLNQEDPKYYNISLLCFYFFINLFIYLFIFGFIGSLLLCVGSSLVVESRGYSLLWCTGFSLRWLLLLWSTGSRRVGFSSCGMWVQ